MVNEVKCPECGKEFRNVLLHFRKKHRMSDEEIEEILNRQTPFLIGERQDKQLESIVAHIKEALKRYRYRIETRVVQDAGKSDVEIRVGIQNMDEVRNAK